MKHGHALAIGLLAMALVACGGNGGGKRTSSTNDPGLGLTQDYRIEAVLTNPSTDPNYIYQDPLNLQVNDRVTFQLVSYSNDGRTRNVAPTAADTGSSLTGVTFSTSAPATSGGRPSPGGELSGTDGQFSAPTTDTGSTTYTITAIFQGVPYTTSYRVNPQTQQIRLRGRVLSQDTGLPVYNAVIDFYSPRTSNPSSTPVVVGTVRTASDGTFRASLRALNDNVTDVSSDTVLPLSFSIRRTALPDGVGTSFVFHGARYSIVDPSSCRATMDTVTDANSGEPKLTGLLDDATGLPFTSGERTLIPVDSTGTPLDTDPITNGTILLASTTTDTSTDADNGIVDGCSGDTTVAETLARIHKSVGPKKP